MDTILTSVRPYLTNTNVALLLLQLFFAYCLLDGISSWRIVRKQSQYPLVGSPVAIIPKFVLNLLYAGKATALAQQGYEKVCSLLHCFPSRDLMRSCYGEQAFRFPSDSQ